MPAKKYENPTQYRLVLEAEEKARFEAKAASLGMTLVDWISEALRAAAKSNKIDQWRRG